MESATSDSIYINEGESENLDHGLISGETMAESWSILPDDPLSAKVVIRCEQRLARGNWRVRTLVETEMTATAEDLRMQARLTAWEGDHVVFSQACVEDVERRFV